MLDGLGEGALDAREHRVVARLLVQGLEREQGGQMRSRSRLEDLLVAGDRALVVVQPIAEERPGFEQRLEGEGRIGGGPRLLLARLGELLDSPFEPSARAPARPPRADSRARP